MRRAREQIKYLRVPDTLLDAVKDEQARAREAGRSARGAGPGPRGNTSLCSFFSLVLDPSSFSDHDPPLRPFPPPFIRTVRICLYRTIDGSTFLPTTICTVQVDAGHQREVRSFHYRFTRVSHMHLPFLPFQGVAIPEAQVLVEPEVGEGGDRLSAQPLHTHTYIRTRYPTSLSYTRGPTWLLSHCTLHLHFVKGPMLNENKLLDAKGYLSYSLPSPRDR